MRVLVAEDSSTARCLLVSLCDGDPGARVVGQAVNGEEAVRLTERLRPAVVLMDVHMPFMDGVEATKRIMRSVPTPIIMVTAGTRP
ncbi:MAG: chemotaxis response regulator protein-glutamate methylesterase, partial [Acidobacteria bacterium]